MDDDAIGWILRLLLCFSFWFCSRSYWDDLIWTMDFVFSLKRALAEDGSVLTQYHSHIFKKLIEVGVIIGHFGEVNEEFFFVLRAFDNWGNLSLVTCD